MRTEQAPSLANRVVPWIVILVMSYLALIGFVQGRKLDAALSAALGLTIGSLTLRLVERGRVTAAIAYLIYTGTLLLVVLRVARGT